MSHFFSVRSWLATCCVVLLSVFGSRALAYDVVVAKDGTGNYTTVQAAINAAPTGRTALYTIFIKNGKYREKITVPSNKPFLQLVGESVANTILTYGDGASDPLPGGGTVGTQNSASFTVNAPDFSALNITFVNSYGDGTQAVAVLLNADRAAFKNCRFLGNQDTLYTKGSGTPRHYFRDCYIDGNVDFIFGSSVALFENCVVYAKARTTAGSSFITAANTPPGQAYGYVFKKTKLPANTGGTLYFLGRPWQNSTGSSPLANNKTVFINSTMGAGLIQPAGWTTWDAGTNTSLITYAEFRSRFYASNLLPTTQRAAWSQQLAPADTAAYNRSAMFGTWDPCTVATGLCTSTTPADIAISNFRAAKGTTQTTLNWNISWAMSQIKYELFRSADNTTFSKIYEVTAATDSLINFQATDPLPAAGTAYSYYVRASKTGSATHITDTIRVSSVATLTAPASLGTFVQFQSGTSAVQTYSVSGVNLTATVTVTPPAGYEVSANGGTNWYTATTPLVLTPTNNALAATISVRLNATTAGAYAGNITHASAGATPVTVAVTGIKTNNAQTISTPLQWWSMRVSAQDSAAVRSSSVTASTATLRRMAVSDASTVTFIRGYSTQFGQALAPIAAGSWSTSATPPAPVAVGSSLNRRYYEQFTITAAPGRIVRVDSLLMNTAFYNTANGRLAIVYSLSGFTTADSTNIPAGGTIGGTTLPTTGNGAFNAPVVLNNQTAGPASVYRFALSGTAGGITLAAGQTLTVRLYFGAGSNNSGRYAFLKDVLFKGENLTVASANQPLAGTSLNVFPNPTLDGQLTVELTGYRHTTELTVLNALGAVVQRQPVAAGQRQQPLDLRALPSGIYVLRATTEGGTDTRRIVRP
ncbi:T9SS type A sorting domain-containing protein [Hymenobacter sp. BT186]|uniref:T9SS type A sorting domain-containing protein n=1 Tax=Hymenobacter telluris TaxID=2816474 RepID=A0A939J9A6_9BACT|nr:pectinesterase family protein [Hymenobacter telluris]MBO0356861.1 T9SS type A sorting domain-containing protein [Hymenobacter telluris]MBW3372887.1 T9SS type A sorting domain-containing protein [Hymenobacter norwichensis]